MLTSACSNQLFSGKKRIDMAAYITSKLLNTALAELGMAQGLIKATDAIASETGQDLTHLLIEHANDMKNSGYEYGATFMKAYAMTIARTKDDGAELFDLES
jgi:hypothetical protein